MSTVLIGGGAGNGLGGNWITGVWGGGGSGWGSVMAAIFIAFGDVAGLVCCDGAKDGCVVVVASFTGKATGCGVGAG